MLNRNIYVVVDSCYDVGEGLTLFSSEEKARKFIRAQIKKGESYKSDFTIYKAKVNCPYLLPKSLRIK